MYIRVKKDLEWSKYLLPFLSIQRCAYYGSAPYYAFRIGWLKWGLYIN